MVMRDPHGSGRNKSTMALCRLTSGEEVELAAAKRCIAKRELDGQLTPRSHGAI
jgi:hypothetical protein